MREVSFGQTELDWFGLDWSALVWTSFDWFALVCIGLDYFGLDWTAYSRQHPFLVTLFKIEAVVF